MLTNLGTFKDFSDNSIKSVFETEKKQIIEITLLANKEDTDVVCAPTHHFCNLGCKMCHLTNDKVKRKMEPISYSNFIEALSKTVTRPDGARRTNKEKLLISFMGVGEPLLNLELIKHIYEKEKEIKDKLGYNHIGYAIASMMPNENIDFLHKIVQSIKIPVKIHFSMHSPLDHKRSSLIPSSKMSVNDVLLKLKHYKDMFESDNELMDKHKKVHSTNECVEIHYTLINGVNDSKEELDYLCELLLKYKISIKFIRFNPINDLKCSPNELLWIETIQNTIPGLKVKVYSPPGKAIGSSCGEFTKHYYHSEIETKKEKEEFENWKAKHQIIEKQRTNNLSWDEYFMSIAKLSAMRSKDPNTQVGACIVDSNNRILSIGYNGCPNNFPDECFPWNREGNPLETKYMYVVHAERNAILNYRGNKKDFEGAKIYVDLFPCNECAKEIIQSGIKEVIYLSDKYHDSDETIAARKLFDMCGVKYRQFVSLNNNQINIKL